MKKSNFKFRLTLLLVLIFAFSIIFPIKNSISAIPPKDLSMEEKVIYLTFDDGPSVLTPKVLDILKKADVKATFFVIGNQIKGFEPVIKRIEDEGHGIGLHTYTHNFKTIYSNRHNFIHEMKQCQDELFSITGVKYDIIRFPGGSVKRLSSGFLDDLHKENFKVYDWNAYMSDGVNCDASPYSLYKEATTKNVSKYPVILLMHCDYTHKNTCIALPDVIKYYKDLGFEFKIITSDTPECYFPFQK